MNRAHLDGPMTDVHAGLPAVMELFTRWEQSGIEYCHWKSNQHLVEAITGRTDLDLLVKDSQSAACEDILVLAGFRRVITQPWARFPGISDWLGLDSGSGAMIHVHLHYRLHVGQRYVKNIHLPLEGWLLTHTHDQFGVRVPECERELIVLLVRLLLKASWTGILSGLLKGSMPVPDGLERELEWLSSRTDMARIPDLLREAQLALPLPAIEELAACGARGFMRPVQVLRWKREIEGELAPLRRSGALACTARRTWRALVMRAILASGGTGKKALPSGGVFVALVGADGSGKSGLARDLVRWLGWKLGARSVYFGIPKHARAQKFVRLLQGPLAAPGRRSAVFRFALTLLDDLWWLYVACYRWLLYRKSIRYVRRGGIVIADRFPMQEFWAMDKPMDGPRAVSTLARAIERRIYRSIRLPDQIIVLRSGLEVLRARRAEIDLHSHAQKAAVVNDLAPASNRHLVNAERPYPDVLRDVKEIIWRLMWARSWK